ncbi:MAG: PilT/PilU family type 4a pilus ATPase [Myxococcota bacterium]|nr:PilT/PilU family type 4a pilus ATPase [Myxococcota bacterium]
MPLNEAAIVEILRRGVSGGASDVHLKVGEPPLYRVSGSLHMAPNVPPLTPDDTRQIGAILLTRAGYTFKVDQVREFDFAYSANKLGRFRVNMFRSRGSFGLVLRIIPTSPPTLEDLILPPALKELALVPRGMILVTGATGSGKSTTLAAMIDRVNRKRRCHILTIEDPIEYLHPNRNASVSQREVGTDTQNFMSAFRGALRQDPDVILVGEMRDQETMEMALKAAETGHLVLSTLHTTDTIKSINRMLAFFDAKAQNEVRQRIADTLSSIVCQRLVKRQDTEGRIAACEVLVATPSVREAIRDPAKGASLSELQENGESYGMQTFDQHIIRLYSDGTLSEEVAREASTSASNFDRNLGILNAERQLAKEKAAMGATAGDPASEDIPGFQRGSNLDD